MNWNDFTDLEDIIYTKIKYSLSDELKEKYPDMDSGTSDLNMSDATFPYFYVHLLPAVEKGRDLEGQKINAVMATFQIEVSDNENQRRASEVMNEIVEVMKDMSFEAIMLPYFDNTTIYRKICRFRKIIGWNDAI